MKPYEVKETGEVLFTDGVALGIAANQPTCEAYGYKYDRRSGTCYAFKRNFNIEKTFNNKNNLIKGSLNRVSGDTNNTFVAGSNNLIEGNNRNNQIIGNRHQLLYGLNNTSMLGGSLGKITRQSEVAIAGGQKTIKDSTSAASFNSRRQTSTIELAGVTIDNTATDLTVQGDGSSYINVEANSIIGYDIYITRLELGGSSGTAGNYSYRNIRGAVKIDNSYTMSFVVGFSRNIAKIGVNGTCIMADTSTTDIKSISVNVQDRNNVHNLWSASVTLHEVISETTF